MPSSGRSRRMPSPTHHQQGQAAGGQTPPVIRVRAAYKFEAQEDDELPLPKGLEIIAFMREVILLSSELDRVLPLISLPSMLQDESWWWGQTPEGKVGIFPANFVTVLGTSISSFFRCTMARAGCSLCVLTFSRVQRAIRTVCPLVKTMMMETRMWRRKRARVRSRSLSQSPARKPSLRRSRRRGRSHRLLQARARSPARARSSDWRR